MGLREGKVKHKRYLGCCGRWVWSQGGGTCQVPWSVAESGSWHLKPLRRPRCLQVSVYPSFLGFPISCLSDFSKTLSHSLNPFGSPQFGLSHDSPRKWGLHRPLVLGIWGAKLNANFYLWQHGDWQGPFSSHKEGEQGRQGWTPWSLGIINFSDISKNGKKRAHTLKSLLARVHNLDKYSWGRLSRREGKVKAWSNCLPLGFPESLPSAVKSL